jgi:hypothetical protein
MMTPITPIEKMTALSARYHDNGTFSNIDQLPSPIPISGRP